MTLILSDIYQDLTLWNIYRVIPLLFDTKKPKRKREKFEQQVLNQILQINFQSSLPPGIIFQVTNTNDAHVG
jgi:hypothetical protein